MSYITPPTNTTLKAVSTTSIAPQAAQSSNSDIRTNPQQTLGWTGIKFPFRFTNTGRVGTSTTSTTDISHIKEAVEQICLTRIGERFFNNSFGTVLLDAVFEPITEVQQVFEASLLTSLQTQETRVTFSGLLVSANIASNTVYVFMSYTINSLFPGLTIQQNVVISNVSN